MSVVLPPIRASGSRINLERADPKSLLTTASGSVISSDNVYSEDELQAIHGCDEELDDEDNDPKSDVETDDNKKKSCWEKACGCCYTGCCGFCCNKKLKKFRWIWITGIVLITFLSIIFFLLWGPLQLHERIKMATWLPSEYAKADKTFMPNSELYNIDTSVVDPYSSHDAELYNLVDPAYTVVNSDNSSLESSVDSGALNRNIEKEMNPNILPKVIHKVFITRGKSKKLLAKNEETSEDLMKRRQRLIGPYFSEESSKTISLEMLEAVDTWRELTPDIIIRMYDLEGCRRYIIEHFIIDSQKKSDFGKKLLSDFDMLGPFAYKVDLFRLLVLYREGGIYSDVGDTLVDPRGVRSVLWPSSTSSTTIDLDLISPQDIPDNSPEFIVFCNRRKRNGIIVDEKTESEIPGNFQNTFLIAKPGHFIIGRTIKLVLWNIRNRKSNLNQLSITGPGALGRALGFEEGEFCPEYSSRHHEHDDVLEKKIYRTADAKQSFSKPRTFSQGFIGKTLIRGKPSFNEIVPKIIGTIPGRRGPIIVGSIEPREQLAVHLGQTDSKGRIIPGGGTDLQETEADLIVMSNKGHPKWTDLKGNHYGRMWFMGAVFDEGIWAALMRIFFTF